MSGGSKLSRLLLPLLPVRVCPAVNRCTAADGLTAVLLPDLPLLLLPPPNSGETSDTCCCCLWWPLLVKLCLARGVLVAESDVAAGHSLEQSVGNSSCCLRLPIGMKGFCFKNR